MAQIKFNPFYERLADRYDWGAAGKVALSLAAGAVFFLPYFIVTGSEAFGDWSWLLAGLISCACGFLFFATATLRSLFPRWEVFTGADRVELFMGPLSETLSDRRFLIAGLCTGGLNMLMGFCFGVPSADPAATMLLYCGFFLAGFFCGLPAYGIWGVLVAVKAFTRAAKKDHLDYTAPDRCGGMAFIGEALVKFSVLTLFEGCLIATYILNVSWTNGGDDWVQLLMWGWIVVPFLFSLLVLLSPAAKLNQMLLDYRHSQERELQDRCTALRRQIDGAGIEDGQMDKLHNEYAYLSQRREDVFRMRTWPFGSGATTSFVGTFIANLVLASELAEKLVG
ncbi:MAG: hypothetical protein C0619_04635 [Desulfuromonas sp.]|nr:MAG: hypothetical protein C0619_04635 [Desulfuromonas sp.]